MIEQYLMLSRRLLATHHQAKLALGVLSAFVCCIRVVQCSSSGAKKLYQEYQY